MAFILFLFAMKLFIHTPFYPFDIGVPADAVMHEEEKGKGRSRLRTVLIRTFSCSLFHNNVNASLNIINIYYISILVQVSGLMSKNLYGGVTNPPPPLPKKRSWPGRK